MQVGLTADPQFPLNIRVSVNISSHAEKGQIVLLSECSYIKS